VSFTVNEIAKPTTDWLTHIADVKNVGFGEKATFKVRQEGIKAYIQAKGATTARSKISQKQFTMETIAVSSRPVINMYELKTGRVQMSDLVRDAAYEMSLKQIEYIQTVLHDAVQTWSNPFYNVGTGIVKSVLNPMVQHWMRSGTVAILGDIAVIAKLAEQTGFAANSTTQQFSPGVIDEYVRTGLIGTYYGAKVVSFVNPYLHDNVTPVIKTNSLYLLPSAAMSDMRPLKVVYEGDVMSMESTNIDDLAYEIRIDQMFGAGIVIGKTPSISVYEDNTI